VISPRCGFLLPSYDFAKGENLRKNYFLIDPFILTKMTSELKLLSRRQVFKPIVLYQSVTPGTSAITKRKGRFGKGSYWSNEELVDPNSDIWKFEVRLSEFENANLIVQAYSEDGVVVASRLTASELDEIDVLITCIGEDESKWEVRFGPSAIDLLKWKIPRSPYLSAGDNPEQGE
jgi:hypothetical protein